MKRTKRTRMTWQSLVRNIEERMSNLSVEYRASGCTVVRHNSGDEVVVRWNDGVITRGGMPRGMCSPLHVYAAEELAWNAQRRPAVVVGGELWTRTLRDLRVSAHACFAGGVRNELRLRQHRQLRMTLSARYGAAVLARLDEALETEASGEFQEALDAKLGAEVRS